MRSSLPAGRNVAITFDDGPDPMYTPRILDVLRDYGAHATFFCVGERARSHPALVRRIVDEGHAVGSHSMSHPDLRTMSLRACTKEFRAGRRELEAIAERTVSLFRPPSSYFDITVATAMRIAGLQPWLWTVDAQDWRVDAQADAIGAAALEAGAGDIVILHDGLIDRLSSTPSDRSQTVAALPAILEGLAARGLECVPLA